MKKDTWNPEQYDKFKQQRSQPFYDLMAMLKPKPGARLMDLGCGPGGLTLELHQHVKASETIGIDSSDEMLKKAQAFAGSGLTFEKKDINQWKEKNGCDIIFSNAALQWCSNHKELFQNLKEGLHEGGQLAVQMPMNHDYATHVLADKMSREDHWKNLIQNQTRDVSLLKIEDYASMLFKLGFKEQRYS